jgi:class 3 adenylate cyclase
MAESNASDLIGRSPGGRKLIAVVYTDMVGYSRLIGLDDAGTLQRLRTLRNTLIDPAIEEHGGRIVQTGGDSLLIVFDSIDGAVRCAVKVQEQIPIHAVLRPGTDYNVTGSIKHRATISSSQARSCTTERPKNTHFGRRMGEHVHKGLSLLRRQVLR